MAVLDMLDKLNKATVNNFAMGIFIDLAKEFDTVNHNILIKKLESYGIRGVCLRLLKSYLVGRKQYVFFNGSSSCFCNISHGVPQGSILGPLLFLIYIDDIKYCSKLLYLVLFADDTNVFLMSNTFRSLIANANI